MIHYEGEYNVADVYVDTIDEETAKQINAFINHPAFEGGRVAVMPDCHAGKGVCVGLTHERQDKVIPNVIGVDIGCGVSAIPLPGDAEKSMDYQELDDHIRAVIPHGFDVCKSDEPNLAWLTKEQIEKFKSLSKKVGQQDGKVIESLSSLGGGNH